MNPESYIARRAREIREAKAASSTPTSPISPAPRKLRTKLKRRPVKTVEVEKKPLLIPLSSLAFHPLLKRVGQLPGLIEREDQLGRQAGKSRADHKDSAAALTREFESLQLSILDHGLREPIKVVRDPKHEGNWLIADGRHRFLACQHIIADNSLLNPKLCGNATHFYFAEALAKDGIPCWEIQPHEVSAVILTAVQRRHYSKGALAYLAVLIRPEVATEGEKRKKASQYGPAAAAGPQKGKPDQSPAAGECSLTAEALATQAGVCPRTMEYAIRLYKHFAANEAARLVFEPAIWVGESLDRILGGVVNYLLTGALPDAPESAAQRAERMAMERAEHARARIIQVGVALRTWDTMRPEGRAMVIEGAVNFFSSAPEDFRQAIRTALDQVPSVP